MRENTGQRKPVFSHILRSENLKKLQFELILEMFLPKAPEPFFSPKIRLGHLLPPKFHANKWSYGRRKTSAQLVINKDPEGPEWSNYSQSSERC